MSPGAGVDVQVATDDGSAGHHGLVTEILKQVLEADNQSDSTRVVCCGPEPMMEATAAVAEEYLLPCEVSLETPMACGIGICFSCVAKVRVDGGDACDAEDRRDTDGPWDYKRTCVDGPVFDARKIVW